MDMPDLLLLLVIGAVAVGLGVLRHRKLGNIPGNLNDLGERDARVQALAELRAHIRRRTGEDLRADQQVGAHVLVTLNGFGTTLYGARDADSVTGTYVATKWVVALGVPLVPLGRFRVQPVGEPSKWGGGKEYVFVGRLPLRTSDWILPIVCWLAIAFVARACA